MRKYLCKLSRFGGQFRVSIPRSLIKCLGWKKVEYVVLHKYGENSLVVEEFIDREALEGKSEEN